MLTITPAIQARIDEEQWSRHHRLLRRAAAMRLTYDRDYISPDGAIVWSPDQLGRCEVVEPTGCSCREYRIWHQCPHYALFVDTIRR